MQQSFQVVVIGGGVIGLAVARELGRAGVKDVLVVERHPSPGQESSSRANGGVRAQFATTSNVAFSRYSIEEFERMEADSPGVLGFKQAGYLFFTGTEAGERRLRAAFALQRSLGVETEWLQPIEILQHAPFVRAEGLRAGTFGRRDGFIDPHAVVSALWRQAADHGVTFLFGCVVQGIEYTEAEHFVLHLPGQCITADWVVNAAGADAASIADFLSVTLPVTSVRRNLACTEPVPGFPEIIPMCVDADTGVLVRREGGGGFLIGYSNPEDPPSRDTTVDPHFLEAVAARIGNRFPFLEQVPIDPRKCWAGLYPETPDHHAIVGATLGAPQFLQSAGFGGHGIMHAPAAGRAIAELITKGQCETFDLDSLRLARFAEGDLTVEAAVL